MKLGFFLLFRNELTVTAGIEILFPSRDVLETTNFVVDRDAARLFYEVNLYYAAFGQEFNRGTAEIGRLMKAR